MPDRELESVRWSPDWRVVCAAAGKSQQIVAGFVSLRSAGAMCGREGAAFSESVGE